MTNLKVFYCLNDHMIYSTEKPKKCPECGNPFIREIHGVTIAKEEIDGPPKKSRNYNRKK